MAPQYLLRSPLPGSNIIVLPASTSPSQLKQAVCKSLQLPKSVASTLRLSRNGRSWDGTIAPADLGRAWVEGDVAFRLLGGGAKKRCQHGKSSATMTQCTSAASRLVGCCPHCSLEFCSTHRLPESHACFNMTSCKEQAFERNKAKLESERTVTTKIIGV